ncbi:MAG: DNA adenine methylase [Rickettsiales bacterium]|jgi:DNA adenine methylase|nr:DNA adenine methylase [Rickettsiales bacterium]
MTRKNYSPLRYPGGKAKVLDFMKELIVTNFPKNRKPVYIEPYAGGAAVALGLLLDGYVSEIYINDADPAIYSFWNNIVKHSNKFIKAIQDIDVTIDEWHNQVDIYRKNKPGFALGVAAFFLNRCNHSGVLKGGAIGGLKQDGKYLIDCRFNKSDLINRIVQIAKFKKHIHLYGEDTLQLLQSKEIQKIIKNNCLLYLDPPYYVKGGQLYKNSYSDNDHKNIAEMMQKMNGKWVVSYDNVPEIQDLYAWVSDNKKVQFDLRYCAGQTSKSGNEIMLFSDRIWVHFYRHVRNHGKTKRLGTLQTQLPRGTE